jgi:hypothetical protein
MQVAIVNLSRSIEAGELERAVQAIQRQITEDFGPEWGRSATLSVAHVGSTASGISLSGGEDGVIYLGDRSDDSSAGVEEVMGYHSVNNAQLPYAFVYRDVCAGYKEPWSVTLSHEALEMLADPEAVVTVAATGPCVDGSLSFSLEVCDPTQGDTYEIDGVAVANFVNRAFFRLSGLNPKTNHLGLPQQPFTPRPGGNVTFSDGLQMHQHWGQEVTAAQREARKRLGGYRRNARRIARSASKRQS